jgi:protein N-terminal methyltransferase
MDSESIPDPDIEEGIEYWKAQPPSLDGVLGEQNAI